MTPQHPKHNIEHKHTKNDWHLCVLHRLYVAFSAHCTIEIWLSTHIVYVFPSKSKRKYDLLNELVNLRYSVSFSFDYYDKVACWSLFIPILEAQKFYTHTHTFFFRWHVYGGNRSNRKVGFVLELQSST